MILTERQKMIKVNFRRLVLEYWAGGGYMSIVLNELFLLFDNFSIEELTSIPSISRVWHKQPIQAWLASAYLGVSNILYDGRSTQQALAVWKKVKHSPVRDKHARYGISCSETTADSHLRYAQRQTCEMTNRFGDVNEKTNWKKCK